jgi:hypothetical protein
LTREQRRLLQDELGRLPDRYRAPLVLCYLEGVGAEEAARALGLAGATLRKRLERGRDRLRRRLARLGWVVGAGALTALLSAESGAAVLPATFVASTVSAATGGAVSTTVAALTQGVLKMMFWSNVKLVAAVAAASVVVTGTSVVVAQKTVTSQSPANPVMDSKRLLVEGQKRLRDDKLLEAVELFKHAQTGATDDELRTEILYWLGEAHQRTGNGDEATRCWKELTVQYPTSKWARFGRGQLASRTPPVSGNAGTPVLAGTGDPGKVFKAIDTNNPGTYLDGKWGYHYVIVADGPQTGYRQGTLKYDSRELPAAQPGDYLLTPWGWMQWQEQGNWLPVAEKPAKGNQLPDPAK